MPRQKKEAAELKIPDSTIQEILARTDIGDLVSSYGIELKPNGAQLKGLCPFHHEKTPSFFVTPSKGRYHCFGCGKDGDAISFVQEQSGLSFIEAVKVLADRCGVEIKKVEDPDAKRRERLYTILVEACEFYRRCLKQMKSPQAQLAREYLASRDLGQQVQDDFLIGYAPERSDDMLTWGRKHGFTIDEMVDAGLLKPSDDPSRPPYHRFTGRLMFTIKDKLGHVVAFSGRLLKESKKTGKYVNSPETFVFKKSNVLYGLDKAAGNITRSPHREAIVCEGQIDCIRLHSSGFPVAVASQGTAFTEKHAEMLARVADSALLVFDDDGAGHKAAIKTATLLLSIPKPLSVRVIALPGGEDPDSYLRKYGADAFRKLIDSADSIVAFQYRVAREAENNPNSADAVQRIARAILTTISPCPNAILKDALLTEAAKCLSLPKDALVDELRKMKAKIPPAPQKPVEPAPRASEGVPEDRDDSESDSDTSESYVKPIKVPPSPVEMALMVFLAAHEGDGEVKGELEKMLTNPKVQPPILEKSSCPLVRDFISAFLSPDPAPLAAFGESLSPHDRPYFDYIMSCVPISDGVNPMPSVENNIVWRSILTSLLRSLYRQPIFPQPTEQIQGEH